MNGSQQALNGKSCAAGSSGTTRSRFRLRRRWWALAALLGVIAVCWLVPSGPTPREEQLAGLWECHENLNGVESWSIFLFELDGTAYCPFEVDIDDSRWHQNIRRRSQVKWKATDDWIWIISSPPDSSDLPLRTRAEILYYYLSGFYTRRSKLSVLSDDLMIWTERLPTGVEFQETYHRVTDPERRERLESQLRWGCPRDLDVTTIKTTQSDPREIMIIFPVETASADLPADSNSPVLALGEIPVELPLDAAPPQPQVDVESQAYFADRSRRVTAGDKIIR